MIRIIVLLVVLVVNVWAVEKVRFYKTSYDCSKTKVKSVEWMVCNDRQLSKFDIDINNIYKIIKREFNSKNLKLEQRAWLKQKNRCEDIACIKKEYKKRIHELISVIGSNDEIVDDIWDMHFDMPKGANLGYYSLYKIKNSYMLRVKNYSINKYIVKLFPTYKSFYLSINEVNSLFSYLNTFRSPDKITFTDGSTISRSKSRYHSKCPNTFNATPYYILKDKNGDTISERYLIELVNNPKKIRGGMCETNDFEGFMLKRVNAIHANTFPLNNNSFISTLDNKNLIRFDKNLNTKSKLLNNKFFWMDVREYEKLQKINRFYTIKDENEVIYNWIQNKLKEEK